MSAAGRGLFITFEGGEGAGKSTQIRLLAERLRGLGREVVVTREPGGSDGAERIREVLLAPSARFDPVAQTLLFAAARRDHVETLIRPALKRGAIVLCDRFADSTRAYQGAGGDVPRALIDRLERIAVGRCRPHLTLILDLDPRLGMQRALLRRGTPAASGDAFERQALAFHRKVRAEFLAIAKAEPMRCVVIPAGGDVETIGKAVWKAVEKRRITR